jgi:hypothetical protein
MATCFDPPYIIKRLLKYILQNADGKILFAVSWREIISLKYFHCSSVGNCTEIQLIITSKIQIYVYNFELLYTM